MNLRKFLKSVLCLTGLTAIAPSVVSFAKKTDETPYAVNASYGTGSFIIIAKREIVNWGQEPEKTRMLKSFQENESYYFPE